MQYKIKQFREELGMSQVQLAEKPMFLGQLFRGWRQEAQLSLQQKLL